MKPLGRRLLCRAIVADDHYPDSPIVLLPDTVQIATKQQAEVVAVGAGAYDPELEEFVAVDARLKPGTWVLHADFQRVYVEDDLFFLNESDVVAILEAP